MRHRRPGGLVTFIGGAAIGQLAVPVHPSGATVLGTAAVLALVLAAGETVESGRWRAGWAEPIRAHGRPVALGLAVTAAGVLVGLAGSNSNVPAVGAAVLGMLAAAFVVGAAVTRVRQPR